MKPKVINIDKAEFNKMIMSVSFLVIVHNKNECDVLFDKIRSFNISEDSNSDTVMPSDNKTIYKYIDDFNTQHYYLASLGFYNIVITVSQDMGSIKQNGAINTISNAIRLCNPIYVVMLGICASLKSTVKLTDVVIANTIIGYDSKKIKGKKIIERFGRYNSTDLIHFFNNAKISQYNKEHYYDVHVGNVVSSDSLLDSTNEKEKVIKHLPEALAYEMEAIGLASSCNFQKVNNWIFIKGISDNGVGKGDLYQKIAINNAIEVSLELFESHYFKNHLKENLYKKRRKSIFISSSFIDGDNVTLPSCKDISFSDKKVFIEKLSELLIEKELKIISGGGNNVSESLLKTAYLKSLEKHKQIDDTLELIVFPHEQFDSSECDKRKIMVDNQRDTLIRKAKISLFVFGRKKVENKRQDADGVYKEFMKSRHENNYIIPIGIFGGTSQRIWQEVKKDRILLENQFGKNYENAFKKLQEINEIDYINEQKTDMLFDCVLKSIEELLDLLVY